MSTLSVPYEFTAGEAAVASQVNSNFSAVESWTTTAIHSNEAIFSVSPTLPEAVGASPYSAVHRTYVDDKFKSDTGMFLATTVAANQDLLNVNTELARVSVPAISVPVNTTNPVLNLVASADIELVGNSAAHLATYAMNVEFCKDTTAGTLTWEGTRQTSGITVLTGASAYGGMSLTAHFQIPTWTVATPMAARLMVIQRTPYLPGAVLCNGRQARLTLQITRGITLA